MDPWMIHGSRQLFFANCSWWVGMFPPSSHPKWWWKVRQSYPKWPEHSGWAGLIIHCRRWYLAGVLQGFLGMKNPHKYPRFNIGPFCRDFPLRGPLGSGYTQPLPQIDQGFLLGISSLKLTVPSLNFGPESVGKNPQIFRCLDLVWMIYGEDFLGNFPWN